MVFTKAWSLIVVLAVAALAPRGAFAQTSDVTCLSSYGWMNNTKSQTPCLVSAYLQGVCVGGQYSIDTLPADSHYIGPALDEANSCECSTVTYSLVSACGACQNSTFENWSTWSYNCSTIYNTTFSMDIPTGTVVPHWAYLDVTTLDTFNPAAAQLAGDSPESSATKVQSSGTIVTSTSASASLTTAGSNATGTAVAQSPSSTSKSSNVGAIAGGVVGGVVGLAAIAGLAAWFFVKRRRATTPASAAFSDIGGGPGYTQSVYSTNPHPFPVPTQMAQQPRLYDPSDPSTFPISPPSPTIQTTSSNNIYQNPSIPSHVYSQQSRPGQYSGVPEV
ncbi:hypothetical protein M405DRAFT_823905 [Rhizopogon salebrosus TDB-379]|nr:hypothetical protein M405DRAFT_823905 [Rhizopogon salebrosus TDB-379]